MSDAQEPLFTFDGTPGDSGDGSGGGSGGDSGGSSGTTPWPFAAGVEAAVQAGAVHPSWAGPLAPVDGLLRSIAAELEARRTAGERILPAPGRVLRALSTPLDRVKVLIVGQDPYPTPGHAVGLSFAVDAHVRPLPRSLANIYRELAADVGVEPPAHGDLSAWADQGVLLLNRVLTVGAGASGSHRGLGWQKVTDAAVAALAARGGPLVSVLWGRDAQALAPALAGTAVITSAHPSPLSASRGFFGSRPFSRTNELLAEQGAAPVDWRLPPA
ncbi:uracil-DNA glycosylase [Zafaria cholistanensis]|uniref:Uracil-DNA glycosylase n=1 Tax=Zafaria cholistanensis TaxID=1682741 RepID=A0A5A7NV56_9MICC|nr:uracil-DNA glycosylase [Zafaria cholistanensis]GER23947.1 uracil-DNA glycosylase [Zafaria cholistanensis]